MTTFAPDQDVACPICGAITTVSRLASTHAFGSPDLDLRPAPDEGRLLEYMVEACGACGYSAATLDGPVPRGTRKVMAGKAWKDLGDRSDLPRLAVAYLRAGLVLRASRKLTQAIWASLKAVWVCDDAQAPAAAELRRATADLVAQAIGDGRPLVDQPGGNEIMIADLLRRAGDFQAALEWVDKGAGLAREPVIVAVLGYEKRLLQAGDTAAHRVEEALES